MLTGGERYADQDCRSGSDDAVGNRVAITDTTGTTSYTYDGANRLTRAAFRSYELPAFRRILGMTVATCSPPAPSPAPTTQPGAWCAQSVDLTSVYTYTADGLRVQQAVDGTVTTFAWDWATGVPELLTDGDKLYLVGHDTLGWEDAAGWTYAVPDALGSVRQATDEGGALLESREWTPYGVEVGDAQAGLGYTGEWWDTAVGLQYLRARWYDVATCSFLTRDAVEENHPYQYANASPVLYTDPSGYDVGCPGDDASKCIPDDSVTYVAEKIPELHEAALTYALPWQVLAYVLESEIALDTQIRDGLETLFLRFAPCWQSDRP